MRLVDVWQKVFQLDQCMYIESKFITLLLGMKPSQHEYKVMGLAPYASDYEIKKAYDAAFKNLFIAKKFHRGADTS